MEEGSNSGSTFSLDLDRGRTPGVTSNFQLPISNEQLQYKSLLHERQTVLGFVFSKLIWKNVKVPLTVTFKDLTTEVDKLNCWRSFRTQAARLVLLH
jgi:hypothetical protein